MGPRWTAGPSPSTKRASVLRVKVAAVAAGVTVGVVVGVAAVLVAAVAGMAVAETIESGHQLQRRARGFLAWFERSSRFSQIGTAVPLVGIA